MNIGIVCYPTFGGSGVVATELGKALADKGYNIHFITYKQPARLDSFHENIFYHEVRLSDYPLFEYAPYETALASKLVDVALNANLDLIHVHYAIPHASAAYMAKQILATHGKILPIVTTLHGTDITLVGKDPTYEPVVTFSINNSDGVTAVSESLRKDTLALFKVNKEIEVIPNFIDFKRFSKLDKLHFKKAIAPNNEKILTHTSNFRKVKRIKDKFLSAAEQEILTKIEKPSNIQYPIFNIQLLTMAWSIKETMFKWYGAGAVDFREDLHINNVSLCDNEFVAHCVLTKNEPVKLTLHGLYFNNNFLTWLVT